MPPDNTVFYYNCVFLWLIVLPFSIRKSFSFHFVVTLFSKKTKFIDVDSENHRTNTTWSLHILLGFYLIWSSWHFLCQQQASLHIIQKYKFLFPKSVPYIFWRFFNFRISFGPCFSTANMEYNNNFKPYCV